MEVVEPRVEQEKVLLDWVALARPYRNRPIQVMAVPMVIAVLVGVILLVSGEWMLILVLAAFAFACYAWFMVPPEKVEYKITTIGIRVGTNLYKWQGMTRWWVGEQFGQKVLMIESTESILGRLALPLGEMSQGRLEEVMEKMLLKDKPAVTAVDRAGKWIVDKFPMEEIVKA